MNLYTPKSRVTPARVLPIGSAWQGLESVLADLLDTFHVGRRSALEFGVEHGYSTVALSNFFEHVTGVDTFIGDQHAGVHADQYEQEIERLRPYPNITLIQASWQDFTTPKPWTYFGSLHYDLIHIDIEHTFEQTYGCGKWALQHSPIVIGHDTESFPEVKRAFCDLADEFGLSFFNYPHSYGLGILIK